MFMYYYQKVTKWRHFRSPKRSNYNTSADVEFSVSHNCFFKIWKKVLINFVFTLRMICQVKLITKSFVAALENLNFLFEGTKEVHSKHRWLNFYWVFVSLIGQWRVCANLTNSDKNWLSSVLIMWCDTWLL